MTTRLYRVAVIRTTKRQLTVDRLPGGGLSGGWYEVTIDRGPGFPAMSVQLNLKDLILLRNLLTKEIDGAAKLGG